MSTIFWTVLSARIARWIIAYFSVMNTLFCALKVFSTEVCNDTASGSFSLCFKHVLLLVFENIYTDNTRWLVVFAKPSDLLSINNYINKIYRPSGQSCHKSGFL